MAWVKIFDSGGQMRDRLVPGKPVTVHLGKTRVCLVLTANGPLAVADRCSHQGESLSKGTVNYLDEIICPLHHYCFSLRTGRERGERAADLELFPIEENEHGVFIAL